MQGLPEREQSIVLTYLVERAIAPPAEADPAEVKRRASLAMAPYAASSIGSAPRSPEWGRAGPIQIARMFLVGHGVREAAEYDGVPEEVVRTALLVAASRPGAEEPLPALLRTVAEGHTPTEAKKKLGLSNERFTRALRQLMPDESPEAVRFFPAATTGGPQRVVPVRFPEEQYERLKAWCAGQGFPMAVVVRGLVERFLDDQERRAA